jgi:hypothetical protein
MKVRPGRIYEVKPSEFPISVEVEAKGLPSCQAFVADSVITVGGIPVGTDAVTVTESGLTKSYKVRKPSKPKCDVLSTINGFFVSAAPAGGKYVVTIQTSTGDTATTTMGVPMVNPAIAVLAFRLS